MKTRSAGGGLRAYPRRTDRYHLYLASRRAGRGYHERVRREFTRAIRRRHQRERASRRVAAKSDPGVDISHISGEAPLAPVVRVKQEVKQEYYDQLD